MAEASNRSNAAGKSAASATSAALQSTESALTGSTGAKIRVQTTSLSTPTVEGTVFTVCFQTSLLALSTDAAKPVYHILPLSSITNVTIVTPAPANSNELLLTPPPAIRQAAVQARANAALERAKEKASRINKDVSKEAQDIFDALYRQFPGTRWAGKDMVVLDLVLIKGPGYRPEDCAANGKEGSQALLRVRKVLENERRRLLPRDAKPVKPVIPAIPAIPAFAGRERKGG